jgi:hypothetical protein
MPGRSRLCMGSGILTDWSSGERLSHAPLTTRIAGVACCSNDQVAWVSSGWTTTSFSSTPQSIRKSQDRCDQAGRSKLAFAAHLRASTVGASCVRWLYGRKRDPHGTAVARFQQILVNESAKSPLGPRISFQSIRTRCRFACSEPAPRAWSPRPSSAIRTLKARSA